MGAGCFAGAAGLPRCGSRRSAPASPPAAPRKHRRIPAGCQQQEPPPPGWEKTLDNKHSCRNSPCERTGGVRGLFWAAAWGAFTLYGALVGTPRQPCPGSRAGAVWTVIDGRTVRCHRPRRGRGRRNRTGTARAQEAAPGWNRSEAAPAGGWGQPHREDLKQPVGQDGFKGCFPASELSPACGREASAGRLRAGGPAERGAQGRPRARPSGPSGPAPRACSARHVRRERR